MLILEYNLKRDEFLYVKVLGDVDGICNLYWQLTHNYKAQDGNAIGEIVVKDLEGNRVEMDKGKDYVFSRETQMSRFPRGS
jgi:hypothetical protein